MVQEESIQGRVYAVFQNLGALALLAIAFPFNCTVVIASLLWNFFSRGLLKQPEFDIKNRL